ncbi:MAG: tetratricopeptide repeat protein [Ketobacteraceae bacterium]|nr:tetratricopeptide repeat protein [Ketobacteraceae bacterium]
MRYSRSSLLLMLLLSLALGGCASKQPERRLTMPNWFDGYSKDDKEDEAKDEEYQAESAADASDRIQQEDQQSTAEAETADTPAQQAQTEPEAAAADDAGEPAESEDQAAAPPRPEPLTARNEQQALEAQQARPRFDEALARLRNGDLEAALVLFQEISAQFPSLAGPVVNQAIILRNQEKYEQAKSVLQSALLNRAQNPYLMNELGLVHRHLGNFEAAKQAYLAAIRMEPNYDKAHYNLAVLADLYLHDPVLAYKEFQVYQSLQAEPDKKVAGWLKEIERRLP